MGCQGEIYNVLGVEVPAKIHRKKGENVWYNINGFVVGDDYEDDYDFYNGIPTNCYGASDFKKLELVTRVIGHSSWMGDRHFEDKALVGVVVCNEAYIDRAAELPPMDQIEAVKPRVVKLINEKLSLDIKEEDLKLFLVFDSLNGM